jgi:uncharacterized protein Usg
MWVESGLSRLTCWQQRNEKIQQFEALQGFLKRWFLNLDGTVCILRAINHVT